MTIAISGPAGTGGAAAAPTVQAQPAAEDKATISAAAQEAPQLMSAQVLTLHNQGQSVPQIATQLAISPSAVQSYLGTPAGGAQGLAA